MSMKNARYSTLAIWFLIGVCPPWLGHCGGSAGDDVGVGTESGNPPVVSEQKLTLVATAEGVSIVGSAGAISPAAGSVRVTNITTGASEEAAVASDGSFALTIAGSLNDEYQITATNGARETTVRLGSSEAGTGGDLATQSCEALENTLGQRLSAIYADAPTTCSADADCTEVPWGSCSLGCSGPFIARSDAEATLALAEQTTSDVCSALEGCTRIAPPCDFQPLIPACVDGRCQGLDAFAQTCEALTDRATRERTDAFAAADHSCQADADCALVRLELSDCATSCPGYEAVAASSAEPLRARLAEIEQNICQPFTARSCATGPLRLPCPASPFAPSAVCRSNVCETEFAP